MSEEKLDPLFEAYLRLSSEVSEGHSARVKLTENSQPDALRIRIAKEPQFRHQIDEVCRHWIKTHYWNVIGPDASLLIWDRVLEGSFFATRLWKSGFRAPNRTVDNMLELFLILSWPEFGFSRLKARAIPNP